MHKYCKCSILISFTIIQKNLSEPKPINFKLHLSKRKNTKPLNKAHIEEKRTEFLVTRILKADFIMHNVFYLTYRKTQARHIIILALIP
jgi:hypothetical protein